jgi:hypothetical protein
LSAAVLAGIVLLLIGTLPLIFSRQAAQEYAKTWGKGLKHGYAIGRLISLLAGVLCVCVAALLMLAKRI